MFVKCFFQEANAQAGIPLLKELIRRHGDKIKIMPGGGINEANLKLILEESGADEFHASARSIKQSGMEYRNDKCKMGTDSSEFTTMVTSEAKVKALVLLHEEVILARKTMQTVKS